MATTFASFLAIVAKIWHSLVEESGHATQENPWTDIVVVSLPFFLSLLFMVSFGILLATIGIGSR